MIEHLNVWERKGYKVQEYPYKDTLHCFDVWITDPDCAPFGDYLFASIYPESIQDMQNKIDQLNAGLDVEGWSTGTGRQVNLSMAGLKIKEG